MPWDIYIIAPIVIMGALDCVWLRVTGVSLVERVMLWWEGGRG